MSTFTWPSMSSGHTSQLMENMLSLASTKHQRILLLQAHGLTCTRGARLSVGRARRPLVVLSSSNGAGNE